MNKALAIRMKINTMITKDFLHSSAKVSISSVINVDEEPHKYTPWVDFTNHDPLIAYSSAIPVPVKNICKQDLNSDSPLPKLEPSSVK